uniref:E3 ubiquitin-protein ligase n=1 Tax=Globodera pallida TaxID=36090 RepID=A0A183CAI8_GLOPA
MAETDAIAILCDPEFKLHTGAGNTVKNTGGQDFMNSLNAEKRKQRGSRVISVHVASGIRAGYVLLAPVCGTDRHSLDQIYIAIMQKAFDLKIESTLLPSFNTASNFMWDGLEHFSSFGHLKKIQFVDTNDYRMRSLHKFIISKIRAQSQLRNGSSSSSNSSGSGQSDNQRMASSASENDQGSGQSHNRRMASSASENDQGSGQSHNRRMTSLARENDQSFRVIGSGTSQSPIELFCSGVARRDRRIAVTGTVTVNGRTTTFSNRRTRSHRDQSQSSRVNITFTRGHGTQLSISNANDTSLSSSDSDETDEDSDVAVGDEDVEMATSNETDHSEVMASDDDLSSESDESSDAMGSDSDAEEQSDSDSDDRKSALSKEQESQFWTVVSFGQLNNGVASQGSVLRAKSGASQGKRALPSQKNTQSTSSSSMRHPNMSLDDSTMPCSICLSDMREESDDVVVQLSLCSHLYHKECIKSAFAVKRQCPLCMLWYGECIGYQPSNATMTVKQIPGSVPGHRNAKGFHEITYHVPAGIQIEGHIRPGQPYGSTTRFAYLPNNAAGTHVLKLLKLAFKRRLIFTIGDSVTTGRKNMPVWNNIHHKTSKKGGSFGYPDPGYLDRVKEELSMVGVRSEHLN